MEDFFPESKQNLEDQCPEILENKQLSEKSDVFAIGVLYYKMLYY